MNKAKTPDEKYLVEVSQNHMNTTFLFTISTTADLIEKANQTLEFAHQMVTSLENILSEFKNDSDLKKLGAACEHQWVDVSSHTIAVLEEANRIAGWSRQKFNPAFRSRNQRSLGENFEWRTAQVKKLFPESVLGFGAIGKGYALDQVAEQVRNAGFTNFRLNAGGSSLIFSGTENWQVPWQIQFGWKKVNEQLVGLSFRVLSSYLCVGVSGELEQGQHIVKSSTPTESEKKLLSALVTSSSATRADAFSTAIFADPFLAENYVDGAFFLVDDEEVSFANAKFDTHFEKG